MPADFVTLAQNMSQSLIPASPNGQTTPATPPLNKEA